MLDPSVPFTVAVALALTDVVVTAKLAEEAPALTTTVAGTFADVIEDDSLIVAATLPSVAFRVRVAVLFPPGATEVGRRTSPVT